jgi:hypothetical protein
LESGVADAPDGVATKGARDGEIGRTGTGAASDGGSAASDGVFKSVRR